MDEDEPPSRKIRFEPEPRATATAEFDRLIEEAMGADPTLSREAASMLVAGRERELFRRVLLERDLAATKDEAAQKPDERVGDDAVERAPESSEIVLPDLPHPNRIRPWGSDPTDEDPE